MCWSRPRRSTAPARCIACRAGDSGLSYRHSRRAGRLDLHRARCFAARRGDQAAIAPRHGRDPGGARGVAADPRPHRRLDLRQPAGPQAWELIDDAGCRGLVRGGAMVSEKHTNFLINTGNATAADLEGSARRCGAASSISSASRCDWEIRRDRRAGAGTARAVAERPRQAAERSRTADPPGRAARRRGARRRCAAAALSSRRAAGARPRAIVRRRGAEPRMPPSRAGDRWREPPIASAGHRRARPRGQRHRGRGPRDHRRARRSWRRSTRRSRHADPRGQPEPRRSSSSRALPWVRSAAIERRLPGHALCPAGRAPAARRLAAPAASWS